MERGKRISRYVQGVATVFDKVLVGGAVLPRGWAERKLGRIFVVKDGENENNLSSIDSRVKTFMQ